MWVRLCLLLSLEISKEGEGGIAVVCSVGKLLQIKGRAKALITRNSSLPPTDRPLFPRKTRWLWCALSEGLLKLLWGMKASVSTVHYTGRKERKEEICLPARILDVVLFSLDSRVFPFLHVLYYYYKSRFPRYDDYGSEKRPVKRRPPRGK